MAAASAAADPVVLRVEEPLDEPSESLPLLHGHERERERQCRRSRMRCMTGTVLVFLLLAALAVIPLVLTNPSFTARHQSEGLSEGWSPECGHGTFESTNSSCVCDSQWAPTRSPNEVNDPIIPAESSTGPCLYLRHGRSFEALLQFCTGSMGGAFWHMKLHDWATVCIGFTILFNLDWIERLLCARCLTRPFNKDRAVHNTLLGFFLIHVVLSIAILGGCFRDDLGYALGP